MLIIAKHTIPYYTSDRQPRTCAGDGIQTSIPGNRGVNGGIAFSAAEPLRRYPFPQRTASTCCTTRVKEVAAPNRKSISHTLPKCGEAGEGVGYPFPG
jgi:hypothetical protein